MPAGRRIALSGAKYTDCRMNEKISDMAGINERNEESQAVLRMIANALEEHENWLQRWHRAVVCGTEPDREIVSDQAKFLGPFGSWLALNDNDGLLDQPVFSELGAAHTDMHEFGRLLALRAVDGKPIPPEDYEAFITKVNPFNSVARRIRDAFQQATTQLDPLTGIHNRQTMMLELELERERALRTGTPLCIVLADIDHFKAVNDTHGHAAGDAVLRAVAGSYLSHLRPYDSIYRYGGEEFLLSLPNADEDTAFKVVERLREALGREEIAVNGSDRLSVTSSFGLCMVEDERSIKQTIEQADQALYAAKRNGRNRSVIWRPGLELDS
ncbi:MAG: diguanylate cyclase [Rhodospirillaceae bacterium]|nr:diguanylate cyclase [Rhodospirillaceae bacterium]HAA93876.1 diguanylate cyclase [Rhodospirillaceae bacterium]|tara:strand:- start:82 stop:1065 length:984 start_codon:yes stop_codon:yes gene_type:complete